MKGKSKWLIISALAVTVILVAGLIGGAVFADNGKTATGADPGNTLFAKVAEKLGIDQQQLEDAFNQAQQEMRDEEQTSRLDSLVEEGKITQDQADEYLQWLESKPDLPADLDMGGGPGFPGGGHGMPGGNPPPAPPADTATTD